MFLPAAKCNLNKCTVNLWTLAVLFFSAVYILICYNYCHCLYLLQNFNFVTIVWTTKNMSRFTILMKNKFVKFPVLSCNSFIYLTFWLKCSLAMYPHHICYPQNHAHITVKTYTCYNKLWAVRMSPGCACVFSVLLHGPPRNTKQIKKTASLTNSLHTKTNWIHWFKRAVCHPLLWHPQ